MRLLESQITLTSVLSYKQGTSIHLLDKFNRFCLRRILITFNYFLWRVDDLKSPNNIQDSTFQVAASWQANKNFLLKVIHLFESSTFCLFFNIRKIF